MKDESVVRFDSPLLLFSFSPSSSPSPLILTATTMHRRAKRDVAGLPEGCLLMESKARFHENGVTEEGEEGTRVGQGVQAIRKGFGFFIGIGVGADMGVVPGLQQGAGGGKQEVGQADSQQQQQQNRTGRFRAALRFERGGGQHAQGNDTDCQQADMNPLLPNAAANSEWSRARTGSRAAAQAEKTAGRLSTRLRFRRTRAE